MIAFAAGNVVVFRLAGQALLQALLLPAAYVRQNKWTWDSAELGLYSLRGDK